MRTHLLSGAATCALLAASAPAMADMLTPNSFTGSVTVGGSTSILDKVGTITKGVPTEAHGDVFFVIDTTGSMAGGISTVTSALAATATSLGALGTFNFGVGQYKDKTSDGADPFDYQQVLNVPQNATVTAAAIGGLGASGGGDNPEQGLYALQQAATTTSWDAGFKRIEVIVGDAPSHSAGGLGPGPSAGGATVANTETTLLTNGVTMIALDANPVTHGDGGLDHYGQFSAIAGAVSGSSVSAFTNATSLTAAILADVGTAFDTYTTVSLGIVGGGPSDCSVTLPSAITGSFSRSTTNTFSFGAIGVTGLSKGVCSFTIGLFEDGVQVGNVESDRVTVGAAPEPASLTIFGASLLGLSGLLRRRKRR